MKVTIIIPNYNGKHFMEPCLASLNEQTCRDFKILIVDNASTDGSLEYMEQTYPDIEAAASQSAIVATIASLSLACVPIRHP